MKTKATLLLSICLFFFGKPNFAQSKVYLETGIVSNDEPSKNPTSNPEQFASAIYNGKYYVWLHFATIPTDNQKQILTKTGINFLDYLPDNTFIATIPVGYNFNSLFAFAVNGITNPIAAYKIANILFTPNKIPWANASNNTLKVSITIVDIEAEAAITYLRNKNISFINTTSSIKEIIEITANIESIKQIAQAPFVHFIEPVAADPVVEDFQALTNHRNNTVSTSDNWVGGKKLTGKGITVAVGDDGEIGPHIDFTGRILINASPTGPSNTHSDHVCGIVTGAGNYNPAIKGQAPGADLMVYDNYAPFSLFPGIYNTDKVRVVSHSLGQACNAGYDANARQSDILLRTYPNLMYVHSSGNSGGTNCGGLISFRTITGGYKAGKNVTTVGNLNKSDAIDGTSSNGPLKDGRIKPEVCAVGTSVNSTQPDNTFAVFGGTSMACPAVTGNYAILMEAYKLKYGVEANASLLKTILMNTADDLGNPGPDFTYGYGRINLRRAVNCIEEGRFLSDDISTGVTKTHSITIPANVSSVKMMLYWCDKEGSTGAAKSLVNNLDATVVSSDASISLPWKLVLGSAPTEVECGNPAIKEADSINNMEQVEIDAPAAGTYTFKVKGTSIPVGPQKYYITYEFLFANEIVVTNPMGGESFSPSESQRLRWDAVGNAGTFAIDYSSNGGTTWVPIATATSISGGQRFFDWTVPSTFRTNQGRIRVTRGAFSDVSDTNFISIGVPTINRFDTICQNSTKITWNTVSGATGYDIFMLGAKYMEQVGSTTATNFTVNNMPVDTNWFSVRAKIGAVRSNGRRGIAKKHFNTAVGTCLVPVKLVSFKAFKKDNAVLLKWIVALEDNVDGYEVEKCASSSFDNTILVANVKANNQPFNQEYSIIDSKIFESGLWFYRLKIKEKNLIRYSNVEEILIDNKVKTFAIYPNPAKQFINVISNKAIKNCVVKIYNQIGQEVVMSKKTSFEADEKLQIALENTQSGQYFIVIFDKTNNQTIYKESFSIMK
jgi:Subtilase family/Secretion system C-terminal sorting domain